mgnify:CR=1 FL=1
MARRRRKVGVSRGQMNQVCLGWTGAPEALRMPWSPTLPTGAKGKACTTWGDVLGAILALPSYMEGLPQFHGRLRGELAQSVQVGFSMLGQRLSLVRAPPNSPEGTLPAGLRMLQFAEVRHHRIHPRPRVAR